MMIQQFDIKIALLGYVSAGKTTVLNALLRDKFSEVSMSRTTAGINFFRVVNAESHLEKKDEDETNGSPKHWAGAVDDVTQRASEVLEEIEASNRVLRESGNVIEEKWFNIELRNPLCEMRPDTSLIVVEVPGLNELDSHSIYMKYVQDNWNTFDCVVAVMDARQGVNTEEQVDLLRLIKNLSSKKKLPVIILFNKVDEPDDHEQAQLVDQARQKVSELFKVGCREKALAEVFDATKTAKHPPNDIYPVVIPMSAIHGYFYRTASLLTYEKFKEKFDLHLIDKIGREEVGRFRWMKMSQEEKYETVFQSVQEEANYKERLATTNFDKFLSVLSLAIGGNEVQTELLRSQVHVTISTLSPKTATVENLSSILKISQVLNTDMVAFQRAFWSVYGRCRDDTLSSFGKNRKVKPLAEPVKLLWNYYSVIASLEWREEEKHLKEEAKELVRHQVGIIINNLDFNKMDKYLGRGHQHGFCQACKKYCLTESPCWSYLSLHDWLSIMESVLLMSYNEIFCETFGREKIILSQLRHKILTLQPSVCACRKCAQNTRDLDCLHCGKSMPRPTTCPSVLGNWSVQFTDGHSTIVCGDATNSLLKMIPNLLSDQRHFGHVAWKCCKLLKALQQDGAK